MRRYWGGCRLILLALLALAMPVMGFCADGPGPYGRAVTLLKEGKADEARTILKKIAADGKSLQMNVSVIVPHDDPYRGGGGIKRELPLPKQLQGGPEVIATGKSEKSQARITIRAAAMTKEQVAALDRNVRGNELRRGIASYALKVFDSQLVTLSLAAEQDFWTFHSGEDIPRPIGAELTLSLRPIINEKGEVSVWFSDEARKDDPFPPVSVRCGLPEGIPADYVYTGSPVALKAAPEACVLVWGFNVWKYRPVKTGTPILMDLPLFDRFFSKHSSVRLDWDLYMVLRFDSGDSKTGQK
ncbi:MAG: hypothetical protein AB1696_18115 [Planctomycetota bacterium]